MERLYCRKILYRTTPVKKTSDQSIFLLNSEVSLPERSQRTKSPVSNGIIGMTIFIVTEVMFFAALISAYMVIRSGQEEWPPWGQPRLPIETTAFNTLILLASGIFMLLSYSKIRQKIDSEGRRWLGISILLGSFFLIAQGQEWVELINFGMTVSSNVYGGLFYLIIGAHGFHVFGTLAVLLYFWNSLRSRKTKILIENILPFQILWFFVVLVWPVLYVLVYLT